LKVTLAARLGFDLREVEHECDAVRAAALAFRDASELGEREILSPRKVVSVSSS
jgi:hypothetical protein